MKAWFNIHQTWIRFLASVACIGAGPAGLTAGYLLAKGGLNPEILEADPHYVGGISRTVIYKGFRFDIGGHRFFSKSNQIEALWNEILPNDMIVRERLSRIFYKKKYYQYPLEAIEVIEKLGKREAMLCVGSYLKRKIKPVKNVTNLENWVTNQFGYRLYRTFFKTYTEKVWGAPCSSISADWAAQRIKGLSLSKAAWASLFSTSSANQTEERVDVIKTLIKTFRYPRLGPGMLWEAAADQIQNLGGTLHMGSRVSSLHRDSNTGLWTLKVKHAGRPSELREFGPYDHIVSSAPLRSIIAAIQPQLPTEILKAAASLSYRDFILVALILPPRQSFPDQWLYIHDPDLLVGRIQNFGNWSPEMVPDPSLACYGMEYFCSIGDHIWERSDDDLIKKATEELVALGLALPGDVVDGCVVRQPKAYPVYDQDYEQTVELLQQALAEYCPGLHQVGRNGMHRYNNQDHSMMTAILTADNILCQENKYDPWRVNQDAQYLESKE